MIKFERNNDEKNIEKNFFSIIYVFLFFAGIYSGMYCFRFGILVNIKHHISSLKHNPSKYFHFAFAETTNDFPTVSLDFKFKNYIKLSNQRSRFVYSKEHFFNNTQWKNREDFYVKSEIKYNDIKYNVKAKLFGINNDHFRHPYKWSFRIKTKDYIEAFNNSRFNLLQPNTRQYLSDVLCNKVFKKHGILSLQYLPIKLIINNRKEDLYFVEDFFSKNLIERNNHRDSYIFTFKKINHPSVDKLSAQEINKIDLIRNDLIKNHMEIMDVNKFDLFIATIFIAQNKHPFLENNFHMFYNSVSNRVEPIIREVSFEQKLLLVNVNDLKQQLKLFVTQIKKNSKPLNNYLESIIKNNDHFQRVYDDVITVANEIDSIITTEKWKSLENSIYSRYPEANFLCKNIYSNTKTILKLNSIPQPIIIKNNELNIIDKTIQLSSDINLVHTNLEISSGVTIDLNGYHILIDSGKIEAISEPNTTITIHNTSKTNSSIVIKNSKDTCRFKNVVIKNISSLNKLYWSLPSGLTFYESPVTIENTIFESNLKGDDFINFFRCNYFFINNVTFQNVIADAIDSDFSTGIIRNSNFYDIGNDAIDGSGSNIIISNSFFKNVHDKIISAGEKSNITITNSQLSDSEIAFASKDGSVLIENSNVLLNNKLDYSVYSKKEEFNAGELYTDKNIENFKYLIEKNSKVYKNNTALNTLNMIDSVFNKITNKDYGKTNIGE